MTALSAHPPRRPSDEIRAARVRPRTPRERLHQQVDLLVASDPGANRLINAMTAGLSIGTSIGFVYLFEQLTHLMWAAAPAGVKPTAAQSAALVTQHHGITLLTMLLGGIVAMLCANIVQEPRAREQALSIGLLPVPMLGAMALALSLSSDHWVGVIVMGPVLGAGTWLRRFVPRIGPRAILYGALMFIGYMIGFLAAGELFERDLGDLAIVLLVAGACCFAVKCLFTNPLAKGRLGRTTAAFRARCRAVMAATVELFDARGDDDRARAGRRLHRSLGRLNETALLIDASLAEVDPGELDRDAVDIEDDLFAVELLTQNVARIAERLAGTDLPAPLRAEIRGWLNDLRTGQVKAAETAAVAFQESHAIERYVELAETDANRVRRLAMTVRQAADAFGDLVQEPSAGPAIHHDPFSSPVSLMMGDLPGSALLAKQVSTREGTQPWWRRLDPATQTAIRMTVAVSTAGCLASVVSERRFYWAVIAVFISFMGTNTAGEQVLKSLSRVLGTIVGIFVGSLLAHAIGLSAWSLAVILPAMMVAMYFIKISYGIAVVGITISVTQLYVQLGEYSGSLLLLRLAETGIGAAVAMLAALVIFPVPTRRVVSAATAGYVLALRDVLERICAHFRPGPEDGQRLISAVRGLDFAASQLVAASRPLRYTPYKPEHLEYNVALLAQTAHQTSNIAASVEAQVSFDPLRPTDLAAILDTELAAVGELLAALDSGSAPTGEHRIGDSQIARLDKALRDAQVPADCPQRQLLFQLDRLDETVAELAENITSLAT